LIYYCSSRKSNSRHGEEPRPSGSQFSGKVIEGGGEPPQTFGDGLGVAANADAEVPRHVEEASRDNRGLIAFAQQGAGFYLPGLQLGRAA
jgi:hypothetical protein